MCLPDHILDDGDYRVIGDTPLVRTVVIYDIAEPQRALLHQQNSERKFTKTGSTSAHPGHLSRERHYRARRAHSFEAEISPCAQKEAACRWTKHSNTP